MDEIPVVTAFLRNRGSVLVLRRSDDVGSYAGRWGGVAGHAEGDPARAVREEIREETGLEADAVSLVRRGDSFAVTDTDLETRWVVHPFLFDVSTRDVETNWETTAHEWVAPTELKRRETVPQLWESYDRVRPHVETITDDSTHGSTTLSYRALAVLRDEAGIAATEDGSYGSVLDVARELRTARPSMTVIRNRIDRAVATAPAETPRAVEESAHEGIERAERADTSAAETAAELVAGARVATLSRSGTVCEALTAGEPAAVLVASSRPGGEGVEVAETLAGEGTTVTLTTDAAFPHELVVRDADLLLVGADSLLPDGRVVNKVGTRGGAAVAAAESPDCYVAAATDKVRQDATVDREPRDGREVYGGDAPVDVVNPTFDVTPGEHVDGFVTERGTLTVDDISSIAAARAAHRDWV
ncbi:MAG: NUDIX domain-containing protein [Halovenus sp.]